MSSPPPFFQKYNLFVFLEEGTIERVFVKNDIDFVPSSFLSFWFFFILWWDEDDSSVVQKTRDKLSSPPPFFQRYNLFVFLEEGTR